MESVDQTDQTCIIVIDVEGGKERTLIGVVVDSVSEVINIGETDIEDAPAFNSGADMDFILGMAKVEKLVKILLNIDRILNVVELPDAAR
jgi:purine-binding chemotaxis protein CheW